MQNKTFYVFLGKLTKTQQLILWSDRINIDTVAGYTSPTDYSGGNEGILTHTCFHENV